MSTINNYIDAIGQLVQGEDPLNVMDKSLAVSLAVKEHSRHKPLIVTEDVDGDDGFDYAVSDLASWSDGFSVIKQVEYPVDDTDQTPDILQDDAWRIYSKPDGNVLRFLENTPDTSETFRVTYMAVHACSNTACTVKSFDEEAVMALCAATYCEMIATYYAQQGDSSISADSVDHKSKADEYARRARAYRKIYFDHLGIKEGATPAASVIRDQDKAGSWGSGKLTHKAKYR